jgi:hypothetical protein
MPVGEPRCGRDINIQMALKDMIWEAVNCIHLAEDRDKRQVVVNMVMKHFAV